MVNTEFESIEAEEWIPTTEEEENLRKDREHIERMYTYRSHFEERWEKNARKWNQVIDKDYNEDSGVSTFVVPVSRMATHTGIVAMRQSLPEIGIIPSHIDDHKKVEIIKDANAHVDRMTNMESVFDQFIVDYAVLGNGILEDFLEIPYKTRRREKLDKDGKPTGEYTETISRDWSRPKIGTRARSPWECAFDDGARNVREIRACTFDDKMSYHEFVERYKRLPKETDGNRYKNLDSVSGGVVYTFVDNKFTREERDDNKVIVTTYQNEILDVERKYANGVLIWDVPLSTTHAHGKITLSLVPNHHKYDKNLRTHALYGCGDPELMEDLDDLINASTNQMITNMARKASYVVGIEGGGLDVDDIDFETGSIVQGRINVQSLGANDMPEFQNFRETIEEWAIQITKKNWKRLQGETSQTATETIEKRRTENMGMSYQLKVMQAGGLLEHYKKRVSDIMEHLTVEEVELINNEDLDNITEMIGEEIAQEDIVLDPKTRKPIAVKHNERIVTRGQVYEEVFLKGKRHIDGLRMVKDLEGIDGTITASKEYLWTREFAMKRAVPDIYIVSNSMLADDKSLELAQRDRFISEFQFWATVDPTLVEKVDAIGQIEKSGRLLNMKREEIFKNEKNDGRKEQEQVLNEMDNLLKNVPTQQNVQQIQSQEADSIGLGSQGLPQEGAGAVI